MDSQPLEIETPNAVALGGPLCGGKFKVKPGASFVCKTGAYLKTTERDRSGLQVFKFFPADFRPVEK